MSIIDTLLMVAGIVIGALLVTAAVLYVKDMVEDKIAEREHKAWLASLPVDDPFHLYAADAPAPDYSTLGKFIR